MEYTDQIKVTVKFSRMNFPKPSSAHENGDFAIIRARLISVEEGVLHPKALDRNNEITIKGDLVEMNYIDTYDFILDLDPNIHDVFGASYKVVYGRTDYKFETEKDVKDFLSVILTENQLNNLYATHTKPIELIKSKNTEELLKVKGFGETTIEALYKKYDSSIDNASAYVGLMKYGLTKKTIDTLCKKYRSPDILLAKIENNPYTLTELAGFGFAKADAIAMKMGIEEHSPMRIRGLIYWTLQSYGEQGFSWIDTGQLMTNVDNYIGEIDVKLVIDCLKEMAKEKTIKLDTKQGRIGLTNYYNLELAITLELLRIQSGKTIGLSNDWEEKIKQAESIQGWKFADEQRQAIKELGSESLCALLGLAGTGKTSTLLGLLKGLGTRSFRMCCLAGKAAARIVEATGEDASTIHRLLSYDSQKGGFLHDEEDPLSIDVLIIDEFFMIDGHLMLSLLKAVPTGTKVFLVGDEGQLASFGSLNVGKDIIDSGVVKFFRLNDIHRQARRSAITTEAREIRFGNQIIDRNFEGSEIRGELQDLELIGVDTPNREEIMDYVLERFEDGMEHTNNNLLEVQVISPVNLSGKLSVYAINNAIQAQFNPQNDWRREVDVKRTKDGKDCGFILREGDKVIFLKNDYGMLDANGAKRSVFNGYTGIIEKIDENNEIHVKTPLVSTDVCLVVNKKYWGNDTKGIALGYCATTHKMQGSGAKYIIGAVDSSHRNLSRQLLYTLITRAVDYCVLIFESYALRKGIEVDAVSIKQTYMVELLQKYSGNKEIIDRMSAKRVTYDYERSKKHIEDSDEEFVREGDRGYALKNGIDIEESQEVQEGEYSIEEKERNPF